MNFREGIALTVLVLPKLKPREKWKGWEFETWELIVRIMEKAGVRYFDLFDPTVAALADGVPGGERPRDHWHPGEEIAERLAVHLRRQGLLGG